MIIGPTLKYEASLPEINNIRPKDGSCCQSPSDPLHINIHA